MKPFNRASVISTLLECERIDLKAADKSFRNANDKRTTLLADLEARFANVAGLIAADVINASAINPGLFPKQIEEVVAAADEAYSKAPDRTILPRDYAGAELRNVIAQRALHAVKQIAWATPLDTFANEQTQAILAAVDAKLEADIDAARVRLEGQSDAQLSAR